MALLMDLRKALWHLREGGFKQLGEWRRRQGPEQRTTTFEALVSGQEVELRPYPQPDRAPRRPDLTVGVILDDFSTAAFSL